MTNSNDLAYPTFTDDGFPQNKGMTKREDIAKHLVAGMLANGDLLKSAAEDGTSPEEMLDKAVDWTDALIEALNANTES